MTSKATDENLATADETLRPIEERIAEVHQYLKEKRLELVQELIPQWSAPDLAVAIEALPLPDRQDLGSSTF